MAVQQLDITAFLARRGEAVVLDVRSPAEYLLGHLPGALSLPLFTDAERAKVGTIYKQVSPEKAVEAGLEIVGPKLNVYISAARRLVGKQPILLYCWRGGQRSASMAWLLDLAGFDVAVLRGGYKSWRRAIDELFQVDWNFRVVGGKTGSGKTDLLHALAAAGEQIIDLEALALHRGSSFGGMEMGCQPSTEHFANLLGDKLMQCDPNAHIWVEDESRMIGTVHIPDDFYHKLRLAPLLVLEIPLKDRIKRLVQAYGQAPDALLREAFERIRKKLGGQHLKAAFEALDKDDRAAAAAIALAYYDKAYTYDLTAKNTSSIYFYPVETQNMPALATEIIAFFKTQPVNTWTINA